MSEAIQAISEAKNVAKVTRVGWAIMASARRFAFISVIASVCLPVGRSFARVRRQTKALFPIIAVH